MLEKGIQQNMAFVGGSRTARAAIRVVIWLGVAAFYTQTNAQSPSEKKNKLEQEKLALKQEIERTTDELNEIKKHKKNSLSEMALVQRQLALRQKKISTIRKQLNVIDSQIHTQYEGIKQLKYNVSRLNDDYVKSVVISYKFYKKYNPALYILNTRNFSSLIDRINYLKKYRNLRNVTLSQVKQNHRILERELNKLSQVKIAQSQVLAEQRDELGILRQEEKKKEDALKQIRANEKKLTQALNQKQKRWNKIRVLIQQEIKKEIARNKREFKERKREEKRLAALSKEQKEGQKDRGASALMFTDKDYQLSRKFMAGRGKLPWPVDGYITMHYGKNAIAEGSHVSYDNFGITFQAKTPQKPIKAVFDGVITSVQSLDGGMLVTIRHGQYWSIYTPVYNPTVKPNQAVKAGEVIGYISNSKHNTELEFQLMKETHFLNPEQWLVRQS